MAGRHRLPLTTLGDTLYENATPAPARLAGNTTAAKNFLTQTGTGVISAAPAWGTITGPDLPAAAALTWAPADDGLLAANYDPLIVTTQSALSLGRLYVMRIPVRSPVTVSNVWVYLNAAGSGSTTGTFAGLYDSSGNKLAGSADIASLVIGSAGLIALPLGSSVPVTAGFVYAAYVQNGITSPSFYHPLATADFATASQYRFSTSGGSGVTTLPPSLTMATTNAISIWAGLS